MKEFSPFRFDLRDQTLWRDGQRVPLTPKAFAVLAYLVERAGRLVTQTELLDAIWPDTFVQPEVLKSQILDVRMALGDRAKEPEFIETVPRRGYRFIAAVRDLAAAEQVVEPAAVEAKIVGRAGALAALAESLGKAQRGERQIVFVTGEQGLGKTTLLDAFLESQDGVEVARGQCLEGYGAAKEPYYPVLDALGQLARGAQKERLAGILETQAPTWLMRLPALLKPAHRETLQRELLGATRERMIREVCEALERFTEDCTLVLVFEDLHWSDHSTTDLLAALAYRRIPARLLVIGTYRPVDVVLAQHPLKPVSHALKAQRLVKEIALTPLADSEVAELLRMQAPGAHLADGDLIRDLAGWMRRQTEGNPLFLVTVMEHLEELGHLVRTPDGWRVASPLAQLEGTVPDTLRQMIELQIERLSPREQLVLESASVHGMVFSSVASATALEMDAESIEEMCLKLAQQHHLVRAGNVERLEDGRFSQQFEFLHAAYRHVLYQRLAPARRAKLHRSIGETMESLASVGQREALASVLAGHFEQCADWRRAQQYLWLAAKNAWQRFEYRAARAILDQALQAVEKLPLGPERMQAEFRILQSQAVMDLGLHEPLRAIPVLESIAERAVPCGRLDIAVRAIAPTIPMRSTDDVQAGIPNLQQMESLIAKLADPVEQSQARAQCAVMRICMFGWDAALVKEHQAAMAVARQSADPVMRALVTMDESYLLWMSSRYEESQRNVKASLPALLESGRIVRVLQGRDLMATALTMWGKWGEALDVLDESIVDARKNESAVRVAMPLLFKAWLHLEAMDYAGAAEMCRTALPLVEGPCMLDRRYIALRLAASAELGLGRVDAALEQFLALRARIEERQVIVGWYWRLPLQLQIAEAWLAKGALEQARIEARRAVELTQATAERTWQALALELDARVAMAEADLQRADRCLRQALTAMDGFETPLAAWRVYRAAARLNPQHGEWALRAEATVRALAASLQGREQLQQTFLVRAFATAEERQGTDVLRTGAAQGQP